MAITNLPCARYTVASSVKYRFHHDKARRRNFPSSLLKGLENAILILVSATTVLIREPCY